MQDKIAVIPYQATWDLLFQEEATRLRNHIPHEIVAIYHIGSTAILNMPAKPVIDILLECNDLDRVDVFGLTLLTLDYQPLGRHITPHRNFFTRYIRDDVTFHLHIREQGDPQIKRHIYFRDYLLAHPNDAKSYANLKLQLAKQYPEDRMKYTAGKEKLIQHICGKAKRWQDKKKSFAALQRGPIASTWHKEKIVKAMEENINLQLTHFAQYIDSIELIRIPGYTLVNTGLANPSFNVVLDTHLAPEEAMRRITEILQIIKAQAYPFTWLVSPYDQPDTLREILEKFSITEYEMNAGVYCDLDHLNGNANTDLTIVEAKNKKSFYDFSSLDPTHVTTHEMYFFQVADVLDADDPFEYYVAYEGDKPVARGALVFCAQTAGIYHLTGINKAYQKIILQFLLSRAKNLGFHLAISFVNEASETLFYDAGFKKIAEFFSYSIP